ncbi:MAG: NADPH-dependent FMN reductase [Candidatus Methylumidiphilus sp.]
MPQVIAISGSPSPASKSEKILALATGLLNQRGVKTETFSVRDFPAEDLFHVRFDSPSVQRLVASIGKAKAVIIASPIYKAAYPGGLKALLDLLPQQTLADKIVLPLATGGSSARLLAIDYAFKPVLSALGATHMLSSIFITDAQTQSVQDTAGNAGFQLADESQQRLEKGIDQLINGIGLQWQIRADSVIATESARHSQGRATHSHTAHPAAVAS